KHLARDGDDIAMSMVTNAPAGLDHRLDSIACRKQHSLVVTQPPTLDEPLGPIGKLDRHDLSMLLVNSCRCRLHTMSRISARVCGPAWLTVDASASKSAGVSISSANELSSIGAAAP